MNEGWSDKYKKSIDCSNPKVLVRKHIVKVRKRK